LNEYLLNRVGQQVAGTLRIREVWSLKNRDAPEGPRDPGEPPGIAYAVFIGLPVVDDMSDCGNYVDREYCAGVWLDKSGDPLSVIGLPDMAREPSKIHLLSRAEAEAVLGDTGQEIVSSTLRYDADLDILLWRIEVSRTLTSGEPHWVDYSVNAHDGTILGWRDVSVVY
jgi:hypothetical protein